MITRYLIKKKIMKRWRKRWKKRWILSSFYTFIYFSSNYFYNYFLLHFSSTFPPLIFQNNFFNLFNLFSLLIINLYSTYFPTIFQTIISILSPLIINAIFQSSNKINFGLHIEIHFLIIEINYPFNISLTYSPAILQTASFINFIVTWRIRWTNSIFNSISINRNSNYILYSNNMTINDTRRPPNVNLTILCITLVDIHLSNSIFNSISINRNSNDILHKPSRRIRWINILLIIIINSYDIAGNIIINIIIKPVSIPIIILIISFRDIVHLDLFI